MPITVEAVYEDGVLKVQEPLPFKEHEKVRLTALSESEIQSRLDAANRSFGIIRWTGDPEDLRRLAEDDEFSILESP
jgi:predicted DNA-binding antitoxin AbrB/MazE fold protein